MPTWKEQLNRYWQWSKKVIPFYPINSKEELKSRIVQHEGWKPSAYKDSLGYWTIGVGRLIDARKKGQLSEAEVMFLLDNDIARIRLAIKDYPWYKKVNVVRQDALVELAFNLGVSGLMSFEKFLIALSYERYDKAAQELFNSTWSTQVAPERVNDIVYRIEYGKYPRQGLTIDASKNP